MNSKCFLGGLACCVLSSLLSKTRFFDLSIYFGLVALGLWLTGVGAYIKDAANSKD